MPKLRFIEHVDAWWLFLDGHHVYFDYYEDGAHTESIASAVMRTLLALGQEIEVAWYDASDFITEIEMDTDWPGGGWRYGDGEDEVAEIEGEAITYLVQHHPERIEPHAKVSELLETLLRDLREEKETQHDVSGLA